MASGSGDQNTPKSAIAGAGPELENEPLSHSAPDDSAGKRGHGAHGSKGINPAERVDAAAVEPDGTKSANLRGSDGWGSAGSGGSTIDKRGPK